MVRLTKIKRPRSKVLFVNYIIQKWFNLNNQRSLYVFEVFTTFLYKCLRDDRIFSVKLVKKFIKKGPI